MTENRALKILETRSTAGRFLEWLANEKGVIPCMDFNSLATEFAVLENPAFDDTILVKDN